MSVSASQTHLSNDASSAGLKVFKPFPEGPVLIAYSMARNFYGKISQIGH